MVLLVPDQDFVGFAVAMPQVVLTHGAAVLAFAVQVVMFIMAFQ